ncbi:hypothetical protein PHYBOEH_010041 [Phytophthora boehmeriae]|uniref:J domain-containing protein n=1 Tax=Phytophthora boehmeriae TaxID=109152 RepID=A0A8T1WZQ9_9STRA|nr:hypothetical protein PHYBOEH_010041 [Phytophthora boehmeriae]
MDRSFSTSSSSSSVSGLSTLEQQRRRALLVKIAHFESRGAILPTDARTLRSQLHDSTSGQWRAVEVRLQQLSRSWNPYQDSHSAPSRVTKERAKRQNFYELLGLANDSNVTAAAVRKQFRKLALLLHPDKKRTSQKKERGKATTTTTAAAAAEEGDEEEDYDVKETLEDVDSTQFARLRLAYETLSDPERRASYDAKLEESLHSQPQQLGEEVKNQVKLEASTDFASLEWMARVKHKMDVMERIAEWAKLLELDATELRFETGEPDICSLSLSPPDDKALSKRKLMDPSDLADGYNSGVRVPRTALRKKSKLNHHQEREISPMRKRLHQRLITKMQRAETTAFHIFLKLPSAVAILPKVALELEEAASSSSDDEDSQPNVCRNGRAGSENLLQIFVHSHHTVNYIKYWMEELTEQQLSIWDQQIYWGDTLIGEETNVMVLEEHGLSAGCVLELRLHDDCPLLISTWNGKSAPGAVEYNTVQISKEAEEDLDDLQEEWENVVAAEEHAFEQSRLKRKRKKMERRGALKHTEMLQYDNVESTPRLLGVIHKRALRKSTCNTQNMQLAPTYLVQKKDGNSINRKALVSIEKDVLVKEGQEQIPQAIKALRALSNGAQPVKRVKKEGAEVARM